MKSTNPKSVVLSFINRINQHDVEALTAFMSKNHLFVDSLGNSVKGRKKMAEGWTGYFTLFPDYHISVTEMFQRGSTFAVLGTASGTYTPRGKSKNDNKWRVPAAWKARVEGNQVSEWRVFADNYKTAALQKQGQ